MKKTAIIVTGPTAGGKSALSIDLAKALSTEIISADSRQIFADIPIVTAQPSIEERMGIPHHLMGHLPLDAYYSAACFEQDALDLSAHLFDRHDTAIVCGGSMMYVDAFCYGIDTLPTVPSDLRTALGELHRRKGDEWLLARLAQADPATFAGIDRKNIKRVFHALEITLAAGRPYSTLLTGQKKERPFRILKVIVEREREQLFARINNRVGDMQANGLLEEARRVYPLRGLNSLNTVGLKELFAHFDGLMSLDEALDRIRKNTRVFAKKQLTWLARPMHEDSPIETIRVRPDEADPVQKILSRL
ncbi:MAG: tRNA (adenosine(37)-N6)-dimethylallyltransferase MiaA [Bacteroidales bacterium]|nr:tRNA (adenosine(37)-N6)-dimethylallyltransferase MiaA [Bacteroidales bacterium]